MSKTPYYGPGLYRFRVTDQGFGESAKKQTPYFFLRGVPFLQLTDGTEYAVKEYEREIQLYLSDKAIDISVDKLRALGWQGASFRELDPTSSDAHLFIGESITAECSHDTTDSGTWDKWNLPRVNAASSDKPPKPKSDPKIASKLDALFGKSLKPAGAAPKARPAATPRPAAVRTESDIPF